MPEQNKSIMLVGPPGAGKTSVGGELAKLLGWSFIDVDAVIEQKVSMTVAQYFAEFGEPAFRKEERSALETLALERDQLRVIATGGGIMIAPGNFALMQSFGTVVCLKARVTSLANRLKGDRNRPLLARQEETAEALETKLETLLANRESVYELPEIAIATDALTPLQVAEKIVSLVGLT